MGISSPSFKKKQEVQTVFPVFAAFQVPLIQNSQHARAACFGAACSELRPCPGPVPV